MGYTPSFTPQYENGWEDLPSESSPITAEALNAYDDAIENIEEYLASDESQANLADAYDETATYEAGDYVIYGGDLYKCLEDIDEPEEWDSTHWTPCLITDEMGSGGGGGTTVIANPVGEPTDDLETIQIGNTIYGIPGGGDKAEHYSTEEEVIGTWLGETLYRKVIPITENWNFVANTWVKSNIPKGNIKAIINGRIEIFYQDIYSLHFVQLGIVDNMIAGNSFRQFSAAANGANLILEYTKTS